MIYSDHILHPDILAEAILSLCFSLVRNDSLSEKKQICGSCYQDKTLVHSFKDIYS